MKPGHQIVFVFVFLCALFALFVLRLPARAAPTANLLKGQNPSFEQSWTKWVIGHSKGTTFKVVNDSPSLRCGEKSLRFRFTGPPNASALSGRGPLSASTQYRVVVWLKIKGAGTDVSLYAFESDPNDPKAFTSQVVVDNITTTNGEWKRFAGTITSKGITKEGGLYVIHKSGTGRLFIDCVAIKPV